MATLFDLYRSSLEESRILDPNCYDRYGRLRLDASETAFVSRELVALESKIYETKFPELKARDWASKYSMADDGAEQFGYKMLTPAGAATPIAEDAQDLPSASVFLAEALHGLQTYGASFEISLGELKAASRGINIPTAKADAARRAVEVAVDTCLATGYSLKSIPGMLNNSYIGTVSPAYGSWTESMSASQIIADIRKLLTTVRTGSKNVYTANLLILGSDKMDIISRERSDSSDRTIREAIEKAFPGVRIEGWDKADTANSSGGQRAMAGMFNPETIQIAVPREFTMEPVQLKGLARITPCHARCGGTVVRYPVAFRYMDGL